MKKPVSKFAFQVHNPAALQRDVDVIDRCNLTVLYEDGQEVGRCRLNQVDP